MVCVNDAGENISPTRCWFVCRVDLRESFNMLFASVNISLVKAAQVYCCCPKD